MHKVIVKSGDCCASLAKQFGYKDPTSIYQNQANEKLRNLRPNMHLLQTGDVVFLPEKKPKSMPIDKSGKVQITVKGQVTQFKTLIQDNLGNPLANKPFEIEIKNQTINGLTNSIGEIKVNIDASAKTGILRIFLDSVKKNTLTWPLEFGALPPHDSIIGAQARLNNLGFYCANEAGEIDQSTQDAICSFKTSQGLNPDSNLDEHFFNALLEIYGF
ncbi:peptidoglycan-binding domain-containing protein [Glaciecola sp. 1036]|uniref:peptidoglycan-binding domain-containing protein n=1 Tax=Alteromonadaceae TaxID=72275 RepID=UPI003CFE75C2